MERLFSMFIVSSGGLFFLFCFFALPYSATGVRERESDRERSVNTSEPESALFDEGVEEGNKPRSALIAQHTYRKYRSQFHRVRKF